MHSGVVHTTFHFQKFARFDEFNSSLSNMGEVISNSTEISMSDSRQKPITDVF